MTDCVIGILATDGVAPDVSLATISGNGVDGLYTDGWSTGLYTYVDIVGTQTGILAKSGGTHKFRHGNVTGFTSVGISTNNGSGLHLGKGL